MVDCFFLLPEEITTYFLAKKWVCDMHCVAYDLFASYSIGGGSVVLIKGSITAEMTKYFSSTVMVNCSVP